MNSSSVLSLSLSPFHGFGHRGIRPCISRSQGWFTAKMYSYNAAKLYYGWHQRVDSSVGWKLRSLWCQQQSSSAPPAPYCPLPLAPFLLSLSLSLPPTALCISDEVLPNLKLSFSAGQAPARPPDLRGTSGVYTYPRWISSLSSLFSAARPRIIQRDVLIFSHARS